MGKGKKGSKSLGTGAAAGAATFLAGRVVNSLVKEAVSEGTEFLWHRGKHGKGGGKHDAGLAILKLLHATPEPLGIAQLAMAAETDLLSCLDALRAMKRFRLVKFGRDRQTAHLTEYGRAALEVLAPPEKAEKGKKARAVRGRVPEASAAVSGGDDENGAEDEPDKVERAPAT